MVATTIMDVRSITTSRPEPVVMATLMATTTVRNIGEQATAVRTVSTVSPPANVPQSIRRLAIRHRHAPKVRHAAVEEQVRKHAPEHAKAVLPKCLRAVREQTPQRLRAAAAQAPLPHAVVTRQPRQPRQQTPAAAAPALPAVAARLRHQALAVAAVQHQAQPAAVAVRQARRAATETKWTTTI